MPKEMHEEVASEAWPSKVRPARRVVKEMNRFLRDYAPAVGDLDIEDQAVVHTLWGWWCWMSEQALVVAQAKTPRRVAAVSPLVRLVGDHADLMLWLSQARADGIKALHSSRERWQQQLWDSYKRSEGHGPPGIDRPGDPMPPTTESARSALQRLDVVEQRATSFEGAVPYYIFRLQSNLVHGGLGTAGAYAPVRPDGTREFLNDPDPNSINNLIDATVLDCAVRCCQAAMVFKRELSDPALQTKVDEWLECLGLDDQLPTAKPLRTVEVDLSQIQADARDLETQQPELSRVLETISHGNLPSDLELPTLTTALRNTRKAVRRLVQLVNRS